MSNIKIEKVGKTWKVFKVETFLGRHFKTLIGEGSSKEEAKKRAGI